MGAGLPSITQPILIGSEPALIQPEAGSNRHNGHHFAAELVDLSMSEGGLDATFLSRSGTIFNGTNDILLSWLPLR